MAEVEGDRPIGPAFELVAGVDKCLDSSSVDVRYGGKVEDNGSEDWFREFLG